MDLKNTLSFMNLPRVGNPQRGQARTDHERVGFGPSTAKDESQTALNNAIAVVENLAKGAAAPFLGAAIGTYGAVTGKGMAFGPGAPDDNIGIGQRAGYLIGGPIVGVLGTVAYGVQALADAGQGAMAGVTAGVRLLQGRAS